MTVKKKKEKQKGETKITSTEINTGGGAFIGGNVTTGGSDFVGRDKLTIAPGDFSVTIGGSISGSTIITGDGNIVTTTDITGKEHFSELLYQIRKTLEYMQLEDDIKEILLSDVKVIEMQAKRPEPKNSIIQLKLRGIIEALTLVAGASDTVSKLIKIVQLTAERAIHLFR
jgi:hypothetical protein